MYSFCFDIDPNRTWHAPTIGEPWNGFLTPHVTADVAAQIFAYMLIECPDHYTALRIDPDGTMTLAEADGPRHLPHHLHTRTRRPHRPRHLRLDLRPGRCRMTTPLTARPAVQLDLFGEIEAAEQVAADADRQRLHDALVCLRDSAVHTLEAVLHLHYWRRREKRGVGLVHPWAYTICKAGIFYEHETTWGGWDCKPANLLTWAELTSLIGADPRRADLQAWAESLTEPCWRDLMRPHELWPDPDQWHPSYITGDHEQPGWPARLTSWTTCQSILTDAITRIDTP